MTRLTAREIRRNLSDALNRVAYKGERIVLERRGKDVAALVSMEDLALFDRLVHEAEDRLDLEEAERALREPGEVPYGDARKHLGL
jgi:antitoxin Phd